MERFVALFHELDSTISSKTKIQVLKRYFESAHHKDALWAIALFSGKRPGRSVTNSLLRDWAAELSDIPNWLFEESHRVIGDLTETIAFLLPPPTQSPTLILSDVLSGIQSLHNLKEEEKKVYILKTWESLNGDSRCLFNKILTGGFRIGVSKKTIIKAISEYLNIKEDIISHRLMGDWTPETTTFKELLLEEDPSEKYSQPYPFYLAYALDKELEKVGPSEEWSAEYKWDGIRGQLIKRNNELFVWSRGEELVTDRFPEFQSLTDSDIDNFVIDGEILAWKNDLPMPFGSLQKRLNRKMVGKKLLAEVPIVFMAYDIMEFNNKDVRTFSLSKRRDLLEDLLENIHDKETFQLSETITFTNWAELDSYRSEARNVGAEGIMLKKLIAPYGAGRKKGDWWKWKVDPLSIDAVLMYANRGPGQRSSIFSDFTFAVLDGNQLVPFAKAYDGLTDEELKEITDFVKKNTVESFGPVRSVAPELVFEISFEGIAKSSRHKSGLSVRFPRISRWRKDKSASEINSLQDLYQLLNQYGV
jgi:DNA ligase-1